MRSFAQSRRALIAVATIAIAGTTVLGGAGTAGAAAAPAATRPTTVMLIENYKALTATTYSLPGNLTVESSKKPIAGAVVQVIKNGTVTQSKPTNSAGNVTFTVTVAKGAQDRFMLRFPGNSSFVADTSKTDIIPSV